MYNFQLRIWWAVRNCPYFLHLGLLEPSYAIFKWGSLIRNQQKFYRKHRNYHSNLHPIFSPQTFSYRNPKTKDNKVSLAVGRPNLQKYFVRNTNCCFSHYIWCSDSKMMKNFEKECIFGSLLSFSNFGEPIYLVSFLKIIRLGSLNLTFDTNKPRKKMKSKSELSGLRKFVENKLNFKKGHLIHILDVFSAWRPGF